ncbi:hypothetical protein [Pseudoalteromonas piscicida]|uniref:Uncharacterized protein n=1 Tax=Pseudoalteromonas piscicida TaxID=43662 RepID=A0AAD0W457_PSEO7|nr:hypothetical protein [Pseudoalteromonas piscicida]ASD67068.1 hypothetical protein B1L02_08535 [Pseudoalteromonas piscicida]AXR02227.1 hypothetical protein D0511_09240 [Pseudoalteromonas piscicida]
MNQADKFEVHYYFGDESHSMDAVVRNKCEAEILAILLETADTLKIDIDINAEVFKEGGLRDFWRILGQNNNQITILLVITTIVLSRIPTTDPEIEALEKEIKQLTIEEKKLNIEKLKLELSEKSVEEIDKATIGKAAKHVDRNLKIVKRRSNLYSTLSNYHKVQSIGVNALGFNFEGLMDERIVQRSSFKNFILSTNKLRSEVDDAAEVSIVSPVLKEGRYKWKGIYQEKPISFDMHDSEFKEQVLLEQVAFKHGSAITCVLRIARELDEIGDVKITGYSVVTVIEVTDGFTTTPTIQGKRYVQAKQMAESQGDLFA